MLTPIELQNKSFKSGGLGYDKKDVDQFFEDVLESYEKEYRENVELKDKINALNESLQAYKNIEKTLQKALILAEKTAEDTIESANKKGKLIENEAITKSQIILADAKNELNKINNRIMQLMQQYEVYKEQVKSLAQAQINVISSDALKFEPINLDIDFDSNLKSVENVDNNTYNNDDIDGQEELSFIDVENSAL